MIAVGVKGPEREAGTEKPVKDQAHSSKAPGGAAPSTGLYDVFFCYNGKDLKVVRRLYTELEIAGHRVFFDQEVIPPGERWPEAVQLGPRVGKVLCHIPWSQ